MLNMSLQKAAYIAEKPKGAFPAIMLTFVLALMICGAIGANAAYASNGDGNPPSGSSAAETPVARDNNSPKSKAETSGDTRGTDAVKDSVDGENGGDGSDNNGAAGSGHDADEGDVAGSGDASGESGHSAGSGEDGGSSGDDTAGSGGGSDGSDEGGGDSDSGGAGGDGSDGGAGGESGGTNSDGGDNANSEGSSSKDDVDKKPAPAPSQTPGSTHPAKLASLKAPDAPPEGAIPAPSAVPKAVNLGRASSVPSVVPDAASAYEPYKSDVLDSLSPQRKSAPDKVASTDEGVSDGWSPIAVASICAAAIAAIAIAAFAAARKRKTASSE